MSGATILPGPTRLSIRPIKLSDPLCDELADCATRRADREEYSGEGSASDQSSSSVPVGDTRGAGTAG